MAPAPEDTVGPPGQSAFLKRVAAFDNWLTLGRRIALNLALMAATLAFLWMLIAAAKSRSIVVEPVAVPASLSTHGYTPEVFARRVAGELANIDRKAATMAPRSQITGREDKTDFKIPGQPYSFQALVEYTKELFNTPDVTISIDVTEEGTDYLAKIRIRHGAYDGTRRIARSKMGTSSDEFLVEVARQASRAAEPLVLASMEFLLEKARCRNPLSYMPCDYAAALELYDEILNRLDHPDHIWARLGKTAVFNSTKRYKESIEIAETAIKLDPHFYQIHLNWGNALLGLADYEKAIKQFRKAAAHEPRNAAIQYNLGFALENFGNKPEAMKHYEKAVEFDPKHVNAHIRLGMALRGLSRQKDAIRHYEKAVELAPRRADAHYQWGLALLDLNEPAKAIEHFKKTVEFDLQDTLATEELRKLVPVDPAPKAGETKRDH